jgi:hypothetical protein
MKIRLELKLTKLNAVSPSYLALALPSRPRPSISFSPSYLVLVYLIFFYPVFLERLFVCLSVLLLCNSKICFYPCFCYVKYLYAHMFFELFKIILLYGDNA